MEIVVLEKIVTVLSAGLLAWGVMRERILKAEIKIEALQKEIDMQSTQLEQHKEKIWEQLDKIFSILEEVKLKLERNSVR
jgi:cell division protein FtsL